MTWKEMREVLDDDGILTFYDNDGNPVNFESFFYANVHPYEFHVLMMAEHSEELICVRFQIDFTKGFLSDDKYEAVIETDYHTQKQLQSLYCAWSEAIDTGEVVYSKVLTPEEDQMLFDPNSKKNLSVYACFPDGTFGTVDFNNILFTCLDDLVYFLAFSDNNDVLPFMVTYYEDDGKTVKYIEQVPVDVGNTIAEKLTRTHIIGSDENLDILCNEDKHYHMRLRKDDELVEYKRLYIFEYDNEHYVYFRDIKTDLMWCFEIENVLGQWRAVRIDNSSKSKEIFWNHPHHYRVTNEHSLFNANECTFTRSFGDEEETLYVVGNVVYGKYHYFALTTKEEKSKKSGDTDVMLYRLVRPRGEPWLYPVEDEYEAQNVIDKFNSL